MPRSVREALYRRDEAHRRIRRLSWLAGGGAAAASVALGAVFAQMLPGHAAGAGAAGGTASRGAAAAGGVNQGGVNQGGGSTGSGHRTQSHPARSQSAPAPAPAPTQAAPQVVSGGS